jgi:hypothetical protein
MRLHFNGTLKIDNLGRFPSEIVDKLRELLAQGAEALPDPRRKGFYDVLNGNRVFFIHVSPVSGNVMLLASWLKEQAAAAAQAGGSGERLA